MSDQSNWGQSDPIAPDWGTNDPVAEPNVGWDIAKTIPGALIKGTQAAIGTVPLTIDLLSRGVEKAAHYLAPESSYTKSLEEGRKQAEENKATIARLSGKPFYEHTPQTIPGQYAGTIAEFAPMALGGGGGLLQTGGRVLTRAVAPAVASETAGQVFQGTPYEPYARAAGALVGGYAGAQVEPGVAERALTTRTPGYVTQQHVNDAEQLINDAAQRGVTLTWPEALSRVAERPVLTREQRLLESSAKTEGTMEERLAPRGEQMERAALNEFANIAPGTAIPTMLGKEAQQTAKGVIGQTKRTINKYAEPYYQAAEGKTIDPADWVTIQRTPGYQELRDRIRNNPHLNADVAHLPDNSVGFLNEVKKQFDIDARNAGKSTNPIENTRIAGSLARSAQTVKNAAIKASPEYDVALQSEARARRAFLDPLVAGPLGKMSRSPETQRAMDALFPNEPLPNSHNEVGTATSALAQKNPLMATQLVRAHLESAFNAASNQTLAEGSQFGGAKWFNRVAGNSQQLANIKAAVEALPDGPARWESLKQFMTIARATGERQRIGSRTSFNDEDQAALASGGKAVNALKLAGSPAKWLTAVNDFVGNIQAGRNMSALANIITNPKAGNTFRNIVAAKNDPVKWRLMGRLIAQTAIGTQPYNSGVNVTVQPYGGGPPQQ
jgi:hypothetical protein